MTLAYTALATAVASSYLLSVYLLQPAAVANKDRNERAVVKHRLSRISVLCVALTVLIPQVLNQLDKQHRGYLHYLRSLGLPGFALSGSIRSYISDSVYSLCLICVLYAGPIAEYMYNSVARYGPGIVWEDIGENFGTLLGFRDHIFAPISEELIYRGMIVNILQNDVEAAHSERWITLVSPFFFGIAHIHHARQLRKKNIAMSVVVFNTAFQTVYTTIFGILANRVYLRGDKNLLSPILVHGVCNLIGFPEVTVEGAVWFKRVYYALIVGGIVGFGVMV